jgi:hypothetical protein
MANALRRRCTVTPRPLMTSVPLATTRVRPGGWSQISAAGRHSRCTVTSDETRSAKHRANGAGRTLRPVLSRAVGVTALSQLRCMQRAARPRSIVDPLKPLWWTRRPSSSVGRWGDPTARMRRPARTDQVAPHRVARRHADQGRESTNFHGYSAAASAG